MTTVKAWEAFKTIDGRFQFHHMEGIIRQDDDQLVVARWPKRTAQNDDPSTFYNVEPLPNQGPGPTMMPDWTRYTELEPELIFIKRPSLMDYTERNLDKRIAREVMACEKLRHHPHPYIATYYGCSVSDNGHVDGLCFRRYGTSLQELCNPDCLNKEAFVALGGQRSQVRWTCAETGRDCTVQLSHQHLDDLLAGLQHLHSLGMAHNDVNPSNIMVDCSDNERNRDNNNSSAPSIALVLVDFDSCRPVGASLRETETRRTRGWHDTDTVLGEANNDLKALAEVRAWLFGSVSQLQWA